MAKTAVGAAQNEPNKAKKGYWQQLRYDVAKNFDAYLLVIPVLLFYFLFHYKPMYGAIIAFKNFSPTLGIMGSPWANNFGFEHFISFFKSVYFMRVVKNTLVVSLSSLIFGFPAPIILALLLNEVGNSAFKRTVQTISYLPHFISTVVLCTLIKIFTKEGGIIYQLLLPLA